MISSVLAASGIRGAIAIGCCVLLAVMAWRYDSAIDRANYAERQIVSLRGVVERANKAVQQAATANQALREAVLRQNTEIEAAKVVVARLESDARAARARLAADQAAARQADAARRAKLDKPSAAEINAVLRGVVGAM